MKSKVTFIAWCVALSLLTSTPASADMSACQSAVGTSVKERIEDLTTCIVKGGNGAGMTGFLFVLRGASYAELGDVDKALNDYNAAIKLEPDIAIAYDLRGEAFANRGDWSSAQADFDSSIAHTSGRPSLAGTVAEKAWLFATWPDPAMRDGARAVLLGLRAIRLHNNAYVHDVLAAAYAETGRFDDAEREEMDAISLARGKGYDRSLPGFKERLALYLAKMPYHTRLPFPLTPHVDL